MWTDRRPPGRVDRRDVLVPAIASVALLVALDPALWFQNSIPASSDLPGHLLPPHLMAESLLPRGRLQGWSFDWFAGFPLYRFYFPLPGLLVAGLAQWIPEPLALRTAAAAPILLLPWGFWAFGRFSGLGSTVTAGLTLVGSSTVLMLSHWIMGGNILSVMAGEFSYAWSILFLTVHLGLLASPPGGVRRSVLAGVPLAAALLCHVIPVVVAVLGTLPLLLARAARLRIVVAWATAGVLTAFWFFPMATSLGSVASKGWLYAPSPGDILPLELVLLLPGALYGAWTLRRHPAVAVVAGVALAALVLATVPQGFVMRARPLPLWFLSVHLLSGAGMAVAARQALRWTGAARARATLLATGFAGLWLLVLAARGVDSDHWSNTMNGLPAQPRFTELQALVDVLDALPPGRVYWEFGEELEGVGGEVALTLIPYWTHHTTVGGLLAESAPITEFLPVVDAHLAKNPAPLPYDRDLPAADWRPARGIDELRMLGVRYLITASRATAEAVSAQVGPPVDEPGGFDLFDLGPISMVEAVACWTPTARADDFRRTSLEWFREAPLGEGLFVLDPGGALGPGPVSDASCPTGPESRRQGAHAATLVGEGIGFRTDAVGVPHLVRASYFPTWRVNGGRGPFPAGPGFMVVVPEEPDVTLEYDLGWAHAIGRWVTLLGTIGLVLTGVVRSRHRRPAEGGAPPRHPSGGGLP